jgi:hypothetical protein
MTSETGSPTPANGQSDSDTPGSRAETQEPAPWWAGLLLGVYFFVLAGLVFYVLVATWPVPVSNSSDNLADFSLFGSRALMIAADRRLFITVVAAGALGSLIHTLTSFADYTGNRALSRTWIWWFILRSLLE